MGGSDFYYSNPQTAGPISNARGTGRGDMDDESGRNNHGRIRRSVRADPKLREPSLRRVLFGVDTGSMRWMADAACADQPHDGWFPEDGGTTLTVKRVCDACPVKDACLEWGIRHDEFGTWGGLGQQARRDIARQRRRDAKREAAS